LVGFGGGIDSGGWTLCNIEDGFPIESEGVESDDFFVSEVSGILEAVLLSCHFSGDFPKRVELVRPASWTGDKA